MKFDIENIKNGSRVVGDTPGGLLPEIKFLVLSSPIKRHHDLKTTLVLHKTAYPALGNPGGIPNVIESRMPPEPIKHRLQNRN